MDSATPGLTGKIAIVTGAGSGIGHAIAGRLRELGVTVVGADITFPQGTASTTEMHLDVGVAESVHHLVEQVTGAYGRIDHLVHAAGVGLSAPFLDTSLESFDRIIGINLRGSFMLGQACARAMRATKSQGSIVNIASVSGMRGNSGRAAYGASKGGLITLSQVMALELAPLGIRVNVIAPGPIESPLTARMYTPNHRQAWLDHVPAGRFGTACEVAHAAAFLCSEAAAYITGHVLAVDGGFLATGLHEKPAA